MRQSAVLGNALAAQGGGGFQPHTVYRIHKLPTTAFVCGTIAASALLFGIGATGVSNSAATARGVEEPQAIVFYQRRPGHAHFFAVTASGQRLGRLRTRIGARWEQQLSWSPDHSKLARHPIVGDLYVMDADGTHRRRLAARVNLPNWSPDSASLVYSGGSVGRQKVMVAKVANGAKRGLANGLWPEWTGDDRIAFVGRPNYRLYSIRPDGADKRLLDIPISSGTYEFSADGQTVAYEVDGVWTELTFGGSPPRHLHPCSPQTMDWSPQGDKLLVLFNDSSAGCPGVKWAIVNADGSGARVLRKLCCHDKDFGFGDEAWSPDGRAVAFSLTSKRGRTDIWVLDTATTDLRRLTSAGRKTSNLEPEWVPLQLVQRLLAKG